MSVAHPSDSAIRALYDQFIEGWNRRSGATVAAGFADDADIVGYDGSAHSGRLSIAADFRRLFADHPTPRYVGIVRSVRPITADTALLSALAGMIPSGEDEIDPRFHTVHTLVAKNEGGRWKIALLQSTPAKYHGRPEVIEALTKELEATR